jgi:hypothetical protein
MSRFLINLLECGAFILIPGFSFGLGLWLIGRYLGHRDRLSKVYYAFLMGIVTFEASFIGMSIDPRSASVGLTKLVTTSGLIGIGVSLFVLVFTPIYVNLIKIFKR